MQTALQLGGAVSGEGSLRLALITEEHRALYRSLYSSPEVMREIGPPMEIGAIDAQFERVVRHNLHEHPGHRAWAIGVDACAPAIGLVALFRTRAAAEFGIMLLPDAWQKGLATRTLSALLPHAFGSMALERIVASRRDDGHVEVINRMFAPFGFEHARGLREGETGWCLTKARFESRGAAARK